MKYSFGQRDLKKWKGLMNEDLKNWKGNLAESLVRCYIKDVLIPKLENEGWFRVLYFENIPLYLLMEIIPVYGQSYLSLSSELKQRPFEELTPNQRNYLHDKFGLIKSRFHEKNIHPSREFLDSFETLCILLNNSPDGFLLKTNKTGKTELIAEEKREIPVVDGKIDVIEVKADKGKMSRLQKEGYSSFIKKGYPLRLFHVRIISFANNQFEVKENLLTTVEEIEKGLKNPFSPELKRPSVQS